MSPNALRRAQRADQATDCLVDELRVMSRLRRSQQGHGNAVPGRRNVLDGLVGNCRLGWARWGKGGRWGRAGAQACRNQKDVGRDDEIVPVVDLHCFRLARRETARRPRRLQLRAKGGHIPCAPGRAAPSDPNMLSADDCADPLREKGSADDDGP